MELGRPVSRHVGGAPLVAAMEASGDGWSARGGSTRRWQAGEGTRRRQPRPREGDEDDVRRSTNVTVNPKFLLNIIIF